MAKANSKSKGKVAGASAIRKKDLVPFTRQIAGMLRAGMSVLASLSTLEEQCESPNFKAVLKQLRERLESGEPFSVALADFPTVFDDMYINMVAAGERSGQFADVLARLAEILQSSARLARKVKSALTYPTVVLCMALLIAGALITFVLPTFVEMFGDFGAELPGLTQALMDMSDFIRAYWYYLIVGGVVAFFLFKKWKTTPAGHFAFDRFRLKMPVFGVLNLKVGIGRFCRLFAQMLNSGVPIVEAMEIVSRSLGNIVLETSIMKAKGEVEQGNTLAASMEGKPFMPILMLRMIAAGEKSGRVDEMLSNIADSYDEEVETLLATLTSLLEPFLMVFLGAVIGTIVIGMFMPIFKLGTVVGG
ncbi:MAG: type II secretion system F family protein [Candidatus Spyradenecus sp.]